MDILKDNEDVDKYIQGDDILFEEWWIRRSPFFNAGIRKEVVFKRWKTIKNKLDRFIEQDKA